LQPDAALLLQAFDERVRDQFSAWLYDNDMRERLLQEDDKSTLQHMVQLATTLERSALEAPALGKRQPVSGVNARGRSEMRARWLLQLWR
jgi:hypothetical protein